MGYAVFREQIKEFYKFNNPEIYSFFKFDFKFFLVVFHFLILFFSFYPGFSGLQYFPAILNRVLVSGAREFWEVPGHQLALNKGFVLAGLEKEGDQKLAGAQRVKLAAVGRTMAGESVAAAE